MQRDARPHSVFTNDRRDARKARDADGVVDGDDTKTARLTHRTGDSGASRRSAHRREQRRRNRGLNRSAVRHARGDRRSDRGLLEELVPFYGHALPMRIAHPVAVLQEQRRPGCGQNTQVVEFTRIYAWIIQVRNSAYKERARLHHRDVVDRCDEHRKVRPSTRSVRVRLFAVQPHDDLSGCARSTPRTPVLLGVT